MDNINSVAHNFFQEIVNPALLILSSIIFVYFLYGVFMFYVSKMKNDENGIKNGKTHMLYGLIGVAITYSASQIFNFLYNLFL